MIYYLLVWFQDVLAQAKTGVKKRLIILVPSAEGSDRESHSSDLPAVRPLRSANGREA